MNYFSGYKRIPEGWQQAEIKNDQYQNERRRQLLEKMQQKQLNREKKKNKETKKKQQNKIATDPRVVRLNNEMNQLKQELSKAKKQVATVSKKRREDKKHIRELSQQLERQQQQAKVEKEEMRQKVIEQQRKTEQLYQKLEEVGWDTDNHALQELQKRNQIIIYLLQKNSQMQHYLERIHKASDLLKKRNDRLNKKLEKLSNRNATYLKIMEKKKQELQQLYKVNQRQTEQLAKKKQNFVQAAPQDLIHALIQQLDTQSFYKFNQLNKLFNRYQWIFEQQANDLQYQETNIFYGFVEIEEGSIYFHEVNTEQRRPLIVEESFKRKDLLTDGIAVRVHQKTVDGPVYLRYCYPIVEQNKSKRRSDKYLKRISQKFKQPSKKQLSIDAEKWASSLKIAVIGNKQIKGFVKGLQKYVKTVERIDAYEYGEKALFERIRAVDYVYVCIDSVPHHVTNFLKSEIELMEKTEFFYRPSIDDGVTRMNYLYWLQEGKRVEIKKNKKYVLDKKQM